MRGRAVALSGTIAVVILCIGLTSAAAALALLRPDIEHVHAETGSRLRADYSADPRSLLFAPMQPSIAAAARTDDQALDATPAAKPQPVEVVRLPTATATVSAVVTAAASTPAAQASPVPAPPTATPPPPTKTPAVEPTALPTQPATPEPTRPIETPTPASTAPVATVPAKPTLTPIPKDTATPKATATRTPVVVATLAPVSTPTRTPVVAATLAPVNTPTRTPVPASTNTPAPAPVATQTPTATNTPAPAPVATQTPTPTATHTPAPAPTATPTATAAATDTPTPAPSPTNTPTPTPTSIAVSTGWLSCAANAPVTTGSGDNDGYEVTPDSACASDGFSAHDNGSGTSTITDCGDAGKDRHVFWNYGAAIPAGATINGIEMRLDANANSSANSPSICVELSWDGGTTWTAPTATSVLGSGVTTFLLGSSAATWGRIWTPADLSDANLRVRLTDIAGDSAQGFALDWLALNVTYTP